MQQRPRYKRRIKLIRPGLQLRLVLSFVGLTALAMLLQFLLLGRRLTQVVGQIEGIGGQIADDVPRALITVLLFSFAIVLPLIAGFGILLTFRFAGPVYRFENFLAAVARGDQVHACSLRKDDELKELCELINAATANERSRNARRAQASAQAGALEDTRADNEPESATEPAEPAPERAAG